MISGLTFSGVIACQLGVRELSMNEYFISVVLLMFYVK